MDREERGHRAFRTVEGDDIELFEKFMDMLNDLDDVQNVYHNAVIAD